ncbi:hypothetical protein [Nocardioides silvaticus]|nr:hypothetical protein [Nocardioides silvaticus]
MPTAATPAAGVRRLDTSSASASDYSTTEGPDYSTTERHATVIE